jgi:hypothetical protein
MEQEVAELRCCPPAPVILHLDSIKDGGHDSSQVNNALRDWLRCALPSVCNVQESSAANMQRSLQARSAAMAHAEDNHVAQTCLRVFGKLHCGAGWSGRVTRRRGRRASLLRT